MKRLLLGLALWLAACDERPSYRPEDILAAQLLEGLDASFMLGAATGAYQVEGGLTNDFTVWEEGSYPDGAPHIQNGWRSNQNGPDSWNRWPEDVAAVKHLGANAYRLGIEWSRLQSAPYAPLDPAAVSRYREMLTTLRAEGIHPILDIYKYTLPLWAGEPGKPGWLSEQTADQVGDFAAKAGAAFGDLVDWYITVNEPNVYVVMAYLEGVYPPGLQDAAEMAHAFLRVMKGHVKIAQALRANDTVDADGDGRATMLSVAHNASIFEPASASALDGVITGLTDAFFNDATPEAFKTGRVRVQVPGVVEIDEAVEGLKGSVDFLGIDYYRREYVRADLTVPSLAQRFVPPGRPVSDLGWEVYPEGFEHLLVRFSRYGWPILVTENGIADRDDHQRPMFLRSHLYALDRARQRGVNVIGYLHWALIDNFEFNEGWDGRFGLFRVEGLGEDGASLRRIPHPGSVAVFQEAARNIGLSPR
jgi:beta-glucosidase